MSAVPNFKNEVSSTFIKKIVELIATSIFLFISGYLTKIFVTSKSSPFGLNKDVLSIFFIFISLAMLLILFNKVKSFIIYLNDKNQVPYVPKHMDPNLYSVRSSKVEEVGDFFYNIEYGFEPVDDALDDEYVLSISEPLCPNLKDCYTELISSETYFKRHKFFCPFCSETYKSKYSSDTLKERVARITAKKILDRRLSKERIMAERKKEEDRIQSVFEKQKQQEEDPFYYESEEEDEGYVEGLDKLREAEQKFRKVYGDFKERQSNSKF